MKKQLKHLITLFLILSLAVTECALFSHTEYAHQYQVSFVSTREEARVEVSQTYVYKRYVVVKKLLAEVFTIFQKLRESHTTQSQLLLKLSTKLFKKIDATIAQATFLSETNTANSHYYFLYIA